MELFLLDHIKIIGAFSLLASLIITHFLIKKDLYSTMWSEYALEKHGWIMDIGIYVWGLSFIIVATFSSFWRIEHYQYIFLIAIAGLVFWGVNFVKTEKNKTASVKRTIHVLLAIPALSLLPVWLLLNWNDLTMVVQAVAIIHIGLLLALAYSFTNENFLNRYLPKSLRGGFLERLVILCLIVEWILL